MNLKFSTGSVLIVSIGMMFYACDNSSSTSSNDVVNSDAKVSDDVKYIKIADSDTIMPEWSKENTVIYHWTAEPDDMHPTNGNSANRTHLLGHTQMFLIATDIINLSLRPELVKVMPEVSADELNFTYELRDEPRWDNGEPLTINDVLFTLKASKCPLTDNPHEKPYLDNLKDIVVDKSNPRRFTFVMKRKYIQNISFLTDIPVMQESYFDPKKVLSKYTLEQFDDPNFKPDVHKDLSEWASGFNSSKYGRVPEYLVGMGPYQLTSWETGQVMILTKKKNHWTESLKMKNPYETSYPDKIIFKLNTDENSQMLEFKTQAIDASTWLSTKTLMDLQEDSNFSRNYNSRFTDNYNYAYLAMNMKPDGISHKKIFVDKGVRRAMALLTPIDDIIAVVVKGKGTRMASMVSPLKKGEYNADLPLLPLDIEQAKKLLDEAGWKDTDGDNIRDKMIDGIKVPFVFDLSYMTGSSFVKDVVLMIQESMYKAGVKANLAPVEFAVFYDNAKKHNFDMMMGAWGGSSMPDDYTQIWHTNSWVTQGSNFPGFGNAESDALIDSIKYTLNDSVRNKMSKKLQGIVYDEQPYIFMYSTKRKTVIHKRFGNGDMFFERPGIMLNNLRLLSNEGLSAKPVSVNP